MIICIDPGHSGPAEPGACAFGQTEAALALAIAQKLAGILSGEGHSVLLTREGDIEDDGLAFRADLANEQSADAFVSIHCNAAAYEAAKGVEVWCFPGSSAGNSLAQSLYNRLEAANYTLGRGVKSANFAVLRLTDMPAVLVECAFITSSADIAVLMDEDGQNRIARAVADGLLNWADIAGIACVDDS